MTSSYNLLLGGYRSTFAYVSFDPSTAKLKVVEESPAPENASWIEAPLDPVVRTKDGHKVLYSISEDEKGTAYSIVLKEDGKVEVGNQRQTNGGPAHVHVLKDGSGIVVGNYVGGTIIYFPTSSSDHNLVKDSSSPNLTFPFPYEGKTAPNTERQDTPHPHQIIEGEGGLLYVPDLGSDRVWLVKRDGESGLKIEGYLQAPEGTGPRHLSLSLDGKHLYCLTELGHKVLAWSLETKDQHPLPEFEASIVPPSVPLSHSKYMDSAEIVLHPNYPHTLFASNRLELQIFDKQPDLPKLPDYPPKGDAIAIVKLSEDGANVKDIKHVRTECNNVRGMSISPDGKFIALAGQDGGGVEIWAISGSDGDEWKMAAKDETIKGVTTLVWV